MERLDLGVLKWDSPDCNCTVTTTLGSTRLKFCVANMEINIIKKLENYVYVI